MKPDDFGAIKRMELHHFSDASEIGYGASSYLRMISSEGTVHCSLILAKTRVAPLSPPTIPRMELQGAVTASLLSQKLKEELTIPIDQEYFWVDNTVVLGYIKNTATKYLPYVSNRVTNIRNRTDPDHWYHIPGTLNHADAASRGMSMEDLMTSRWFTCSEVLWNPTLKELMTKQSKKFPTDEKDKSRK